jgi:hypothetical protein
MSYIDLAHVDYHVNDIVQWTKKINHDMLKLPVNNSTICKWCQYTDLCLDKKEKAAIVDIEPMQYRKWHNDKPKRI